VPHNEVTPEMIESAAKAWYEATGEIFGNVVSHGWNSLSEDVRGIHRKLATAALTAALALAPSDERPRGSLNDVQGIR
jgi:hypothetical protein